MCNGQMICSGISMFQYERRIWMTNLPNLVLMHSHDTGRHLGCYGAGVPTPNLMRLAREGVLFRQAFCASPGCSSSRASLMTGQWPHTHGLIGLVHRGWRMNDP